MNKLLLYPLSLFFLAQETNIAKKESISAQHKLDSIQLNEGYEIRKDNECFKVHDHHTVVLHEPQYDDLNSLDDYDQVQVAQLNESIAQETAAGFWLVKLAVHATAQVVYAVVAGAASFVYPHAGPIVYCSLQLTYAALVEITSNLIVYGIR